MLAEGLKKGFGVGVSGSRVSRQGERCEGFDYRIYHRFHPQAELAYLEHTRLPPDEPDQWS
jgi:hypothetical protein